MGIIIALILWYLSGGLDMFLHDLPSFEDIFKIHLLIPDANYYNNELPIEYDPNADNDFLIDDKFGLHDYGLDEEYFLNRDEDYIMNLNEQANNDEERYENDLSRAIDASIRDLN